MKNTIIIALALLSASATAQVSAGQYALQRKNVGAGFSLIPLTPTADNIWTFNGSGGVTSIPRNTFALSGHIHALDDLSDVILTAPSNGQVLQYNGTNWVNATVAGGSLSDGDKGDITVSGSGATWTIDNDVVSNAKLANMAQATFKGRASGAGTGDPTDLSADQASTILDGATDPFVRTSAQLQTSLGGNGAADAGKVAEYNLEGQLRASVNGSSTPAIWGTSTGAGFAGYFNAASAVEAVQIFNFGAGPSLLSRNGSTGLGADIEAAGKALSVHAAYTGVGTPDIADFETGLVPAVQLRVKNDGGLEWPSAGTGPQTTATNLPAFGSGTKGVVPASGGGTTNFLRADGTWAVPPGSGGTVTSVAASGSNGVSISGSPITTSGTLTIGLGAITPTSVSASGTVGGSNLSGTNTGDQDLSGLMVKANNLSDVSNVNTARENLGLVRRKITTATTGVSTSYTDVTDMSFSVVAGTTYSFIATVLAECSSTSGGVCLTANGPAATWFAARYEGSQAAGSIIRPDITAYDTMGSLADPNSVAAANTPYVFTLQGVIVPSANGTFTLRVKRGGTTGNVAVRAGVLEATAM